MKRIFYVLICMFFSANIFAQEAKLYNPAADAEKDIAEAIKKAKTEHKFVLIQDGGNWCSWCIEFARVAKSDPTLDSVMNASFVWYHLNYSKENKNEKILAKYGYPQRFGFPVFIILNDKGEQIHIQNSEYLEDGKKSYNHDKVKEFLEGWSPKALDPKQYEVKS